ncbi:hypothetical protein GUJ93_ZPchr0010g8155 [Zizania palustris]|uniref:Uncharacterized protein n=1 Tax=Zizania palustris TaxID=103762 RepID=A0A8J6BPA7_ZIZPA|nr:hypothetical protein GUJ93_ZPchr0010g8155 [Zizania palustris]
MGHRSRGILYHNHQLTSSLADTRSPENSRDGIVVLMININMQIFLGIWDRKNPLMKMVDAIVVDGVELHLVDFIKHSITLDDGKIFM